MSRRLLIEEAVGRLEEDLGLNQESDSYPEIIVTLMNQNDELILCYVIFLYFCLLHSHWLPFDSAHCSSLFPSCVFLGSHS